MFQLVVVQIQVANIGQFGNVLWQKLQLIFAQIQFGQMSEGAKVLLLKIDLFLIIVWVNYSALYYLPPK